MTSRKTAIVTGASQGIGAAITKLLLGSGYNVVATSRHITTANALPPSDRLALIEGDISHESTATEVVRTALQSFGSVDVLVNNAGIFISKPFTEYTRTDFGVLSSINAEGFLHTTQTVIREMLKQDRGGSVVTITASLAEQPLSSVPASYAMLFKGGLEAITRSLAIEYAPAHIRFNAVAPGIVDTPMHAQAPKDFLRSLSPMGTIADADEIASAVLFLCSAPSITGEVLRVDGGTHAGR
ncbi:MAG TPA: SDR family oxidoreductase [Acidobacteriaceae bacterium]|nr:SDR family oxidoreductase [Acidobacteriaceae bacterium]